MGLPASAVSGGLARLGNENPVITFVIDNATRGVQSLGNHLDRGTDPAVVRPLRVPALWRCGSGATCRHDHRRQADGQDAQGHAPTHFLHAKPPSQFFRTARPNCWTNTKCYGCREVRAIRRNARLPSSPIGTAATRCGRNKYGFRDRPVTQQMCPTHGAPPQTLRVRRFGGPVRRQVRSKKRPARLV